MSADRCYKERVNPVMRPCHSNCLTQSTILLCVFVLAGGLSACSAPREGVRSPGRYYVIAYVFGERGGDLRHIDAARLTHINYAFANVDSLGRIVLERERDAAHLAKLNSLRARNPDLKILLSVGGWGWSDHFSDAALTDSSRAEFARTGVELVRTYALDGLDIDWEYPGQRGEDNVYRAEDKENFTLMLGTLREALDAQGRQDGHRYLLTIASGANDTYLAHTEMDKAHEYLDFVNIMTYDFYGNYTSTSGHHTNLFRSDAPNAPDVSAQAGVEGHIGAGIPADKIVLGAAFYGKGWRGVGTEHGGRYQPYESYYGSIPYGRLASELVGRNGFVRYWDEGARAPYLWNSDSTIFITYDDPESMMHKARFVIDRGLAGMMYWEHGHDPGQELLRAIHESLNRP